jgi:hypothetical protein
MILLSSDDYSWGGGGCSHCRRGPHAKAPQSSSCVTGESSYRRMSSWLLESTMSRRLLRRRICRRSSRRNSRIASLSCSTAGWYGCGGGKADVRLVVEEIRDFLVDAEEAVPGVKRRDGVGRVGLGGRGHGRCCCCEAAKADC